MTEGGWQEPNRRTKLRWGRYDERYLGGMLYIIAGGVVLAPSNTYTVIFLLLGTVAHVGGWFILPSSGARRLWAFWPSLLSIWLLLVGPQTVAVMVFPLLGWLIVRERPLRSYVVLVFPIVSGVIIAYSLYYNTAEPLALGIESAVVVGSAWLARYLATTKRSSTT